MDKYDIAAKNALCIALDVSENQAARLINNLSTFVGVIKITARNLIGLHYSLETHISDIKERGYKVFLDLKAHDIPNTVAGIVEKVAHTGADYMTIHASGGPEMIKAARKATEGSQLKLLAVTVLTSLDTESLTTIFGKPLGVPAGLQFTKDDIEKMVVHLAYLAADNGAYGIVCSPKELEFVKQLRSADFIIVTPGIRLPSSDTHDQKRITTPEMAIKNGSDLLVVGRAITQAFDPVAAAKEIHSKIVVALKARAEKEKDV